MKWTRSTISRDQLYRIQFLEWNAWFLLNKSRSYWIVYVYEFVGNWKKKMHGIYKMQKYLIDEVNLYLNPISIVNVP